MEVTSVEQGTYIKIAFRQGGNLLCDFYLISNIKKPIRFKRFATREDIANAVRQQVTLFTHSAANAEADGIQCLPHRWQRVVSVAGDYTTRGLLATDHVILNHGQVTWTTPELAPPLLTTTPHQREDVSALDRFNVHRCPTRRVFSGTGLEPVTKQATVRYLYHSATAAVLSLEESQQHSHPLN
ncbi:uncharacterized protein TNCV_3957671 [Trichonephila clavipes]|nr:uncharacterized protein TNCV_3957671 [Trichonephila clavipes]